MDQRAKSSVLSGVEKRMTDSGQGFEVVSSVACVEGRRECASSPPLEEGALSCGINDALREEPRKGAVSGIAHGTADEGRDADTAADFFGEGLICSRDNGCRESGYELTEQCFGVGWQGDATDDGV